MTKVGRDLWIRLQGASKHAGEAIDEAWSWILRYREESLARASQETKGKSFPWREPFDGEGRPLITGSEAMSLIIRLAYSHDVDSPRLESARVLVEEGVDELMERLDVYRSQAGKGSGKALYRADPYLTEFRLGEKVSGIGHEAGVPDHESVDRIWTITESIDTAASLLTMLSLAAGFERIDWPRLACRDEVWRALVEVLEFLHSARRSDGLWGSTDAATLRRLPGAPAEKEPQRCVYHSSRAIIALCHAHALLMQAGTSPLSLLDSAAAEGEVERCLTMVRECLRAGVDGLLSCATSRGGAVDDSVLDALEPTGWLAQFADEEDAAAFAAILPSIAAQCGIPASALEDRGAPQQAIGGMWAFRLPLAHQVEPEQSDPATALLRACVVGTGGELVERFGNRSSEQVGWRGDGSHGTAELFPTALATLALCEFTNMSTATLSRIRPLARLDAGILSSAAFWLVQELSERLDAKREQLSDAISPRFTVGRVQTDYECGVYDLVAAIGAYRHLSFTDLTDVMASAGRSTALRPFDDAQELAYIDVSEWILRGYAATTDDASGLRVARAGGFVCCGSAYASTRPLSGIRATERALAAIRHFESQHRIRSVGTIFDECFGEAKRSIVASMKADYEPLENEHQIRVAWGLIEDESRRGSA